MEKVLVEVYVPVLERSYDMFIPKASSMAQVLELMKKAVKEMSDDTFVANENTTLCHREDGTIININLSVAELDIRNGTKLMLI